MPLPTVVVDSLHGGRTSYKDGGVDDDGADEQAG
jgi:hypothetical protein